LTHTKFTKQEGTYASGIRWSVDYPEILHIFHLPNTKQYSEMVHFLFVSSLHFTIHELYFYAPLKSFPI